jgi:hypothetical protein
MKHDKQHVIYYICISAVQLVKHHFPTFRFLSRVNYYESTISHPLFHTQLHPLSFSSRPIANLSVHNVASFGRLDLHLA